MIDEICDEKYECIGVRVYPLLTQTQIRYMQKLSNSNRF